jgi:hypothetical protein
MSSHGREKNVDHRLSETVPSGTPSPRFPANRGWRRHLCPFFYRFAWVLLLVLAIAGHVRADRDRPSRTVVCSDDRFRASLERIEPGWELVVRTDEQLRHVAVDDLVQWGGLRDSDRGPQIVLPDGSWLTGEVLQIDQDQLQIGSSLWGGFSVPRESIRGVIFNPSVDPVKRDQIRRQVLEAEGAEDLLWLENGDFVTGTVRELIETQHGPDDLSVSLALVTRGREVLLSLNKITALVFNPSRSTRVSPRAQHVLLGLADGSRLTAQSLDLRGSLASLTLLGGMQLTIDHPSLWDLVVLVQPMNAGTVYVSDLESIGYKHLPLLTQTLPQGRDRNSRGGSLRAGGDLYAKGLGMPSASRAAYALRGRYQRFAAEVALDDSAGASGSVVFRVFFSDGQGGWQAAWESPPVRSGDAPRPVSVDTRGVQAMALIVDMGERGDVQDHAVWLNARLMEHP